MLDKEAGGTILVVDDEPNLVFFLRRLCESQDYEVITAGSGFEALKYLRDFQGRMDLVILDLRMPGMGGLAALKAIRQDFGNVPVIILTALQEKKLECEALGVEAFIVKPFSLEELCQKIDSIISWRKTAKEARIAVKRGYIPRAKILIVDDEEEICQLLSDLLSKENQAYHYDVQTATNGDDALRIADHFHPDIAIIDMKMPYIWGDELIERFKSKESFCPKDFLIFSGSDLPEEKERSRKTGHKVIHKLGGDDMLLDTLERICVRHKLLQKISKEKAG
ncbi:MAG: response regulator [Candidatus Omnitrophica bacterium]|nr:response regulator [Candidatus Omnitrophota bacterium]